MLKIFISGIIIVCLLACENNSPNDFEEENIMSPSPPEVDSGVTYTNTIRGIMMDHCLQCHSSPTRNGAPFPLTTFQEVRSRVASINTAMNDINDPMPPAGLIAESQRSQIQKWIDNNLAE